ncbi:MAG: DUF2784 domain-containing protein [Gammaproteobacteria bacterium]
MLAAFAADLVVTMHFGFILFVILGGLLVSRWRRVAWLHLPAAAWGASIGYFGWTCPLTPLENHLRVVAGQGGYPHGFIQEYLEPLVYPAGLDADGRIWLGVGVLVVNALIYALIYAWALRR